MLTTETLTQELREALPRKYYPAIPALAEAIAEMTTRNGQPLFDAIVRLVPNPALDPPLQALEGESLRCGSVALTFGADQQIVVARSAEPAQTHFNGPTTQVFGPQTNVNTQGGDYYENQHIQTVGYIGQLNVAKLTLVQTPGGGRVDVVKVVASRPQRRPQPPLKLPSHTPRLVGRERELAAAEDALLASNVLEIYAPPASGKTTLLQYLAHSQATRPWPDGTIFLNLLPKDPEDLLQLLHEYFYEDADRSQPKLTLQGLMADLRQQQTLVLLDNDGLEKPGLEALLEALKSGVVVLTTEAKERRFAAGRGLRLRGLSPDAARALFEQELGRPCTPDEATVVAALNGAWNGAARRIVLAAQQLRDEGVTLQELVAETQTAAPDTHGALRQELAGLSGEQRRVVAILSLLKGESLGEEHVLALANLPDAAPAVTQLVQKGIARSYSPRYSLVGAYQPFVLDANAAAVVLRRMLRYFIEWASQPATTVESVLADLGALLVLLEGAAAEGLWDEVLRLARAIEPALIVGKRWGAWERVLEWQLQAARALGNEAAQGWALHQRGTRALCEGDAAAARAALTSALKIRERIGDRDGIAVTRHNLRLLTPPPPPTSQSPTPAPAPPAPRRRAGFSRFVGLLAILLMAGTVAAFGWPYLQSFFTADDPPPSGNGGQSVPVAPRADAPTRTHTAPPTETTQQNVPVNAAPKPPTITPIPTITPTSEPAPPAAPPQPAPRAQINLFEPKSPSIVVGEQTELCFDLKDAISALIEPGKIIVDPNRENCVSVRPKTETTYTLIVFGRDGDQVSAQTTVKVSQRVPAAIINKFALETNGSTQMLCYDIENAESASIEPFDGLLSDASNSKGALTNLSQGCVEVAPTATTDYFLIVTGTDGNQIRSKPFRVIGTPP